MTNERIIELRSPMNGDAYDEGNSSLAPPDRGGNDTAQERFQHRAIARQKEYTMTSLDSLSTFGSELTTEQMDSVDGGIIPALIVLNMVIWGANGVVYVAKQVS